jgi:hypothetical protein
MKAQTSMRSSDRNEEPSRGETTGEAEPKPLEKSTRAGKTDRTDEANPDSVAAALEEVGLSDGEVLPGGSGTGLDVAPALEKQNSMRPPEEERLDAWRR